jgi:hypothetical protein
VWLGLASCGEHRPAAAPAAGPAPEQAVSVAPPPASSGSSAPAAPPAGVAAVEAVAPAPAAEAPGEADGAQPKRVSLWVQFDDGFGARDMKTPAIATLTADGAPLSRLELRKQGNPMTHQHWGQVSGQIETCESSVKLGVHIEPPGLRDEHTLDLTRGSFLVLTHDRARGRVRIKQYKARPLYR